MDPFNNPASILICLKMDPFKIPAQFDNSDQGARQHAEEIRGEASRLVNERWRRDDHESEHFKLTFILI